MPDVHSKFSPSSANRWLACPASLQFKEANSANEYTAAGTVAHSLAQECWLLGIDADNFLGDTREVDGFEVEVDKEMVQAVNVYLDFIRCLARDSQLADMDANVEWRIEHGQWPDFGGTIDFAVPEKLHLVDFKYGAGVAVDVIENAQMCCYALLLQEQLQNDMDVTLTIVQPRAHHADGPVRTWTASWEYLDRFRARVRKVIEGKWEEDKFFAGDHCRWCPHKVLCPELFNLTLELAKKEFQEDLIDPNTASVVMSKKTAIKSYLDAIDKWAHGQMDKGVKIPGFKLVNTFGNRRYAVNEEDVVRMCRNRKIGKKLIYRTELLSPSQLEKVVGKDLVSSLVERPHTGTTVVPESDRREAATRMTASEEFNSEGMFN